MRNLSADKLKSGQRRIWIPLDCAKGERSVSARDLVTYAAILDSADNETRRWSATNAAVAHRAGFAVKWLPKSLARLVAHGLLLHDEGKPGVAGLTVPRGKQGEAFVRFPVSALWASPTSAPRWTGGDLTLAVRAMLALLSVTDFDNGDPEQVQVIDKPREYVAKVAGLDVTRYDRGLALLSAEPWLSGVKGAYRVENHLVKRQPTTWSIRWSDADDVLWTPEGKEQAGYDPKGSSERVTADQEEQGKEQAGYDPEVSSERVTRSVLSGERGKEQAGYEVRNRRVTRSVLSGTYTDTLLSSNSSHQILSSPDTFSISSLPPSSSNSPGDEPRSENSTEVAPSPSLAITSQEEEGRVDEETNEEKTSVTYTVKPEFQKYGRNFKTERENLVGLLLSNLPSEVATTIDTELHSPGGVSPKEMHNRLVSLVERKWKLPEVVEFCLERISYTSGGFDDYWLNDFGLPDKRNLSPAAELELQEEKRQRQAAQEADDARKNEQLGKLGAGSELLSFISNLEPNVRRALTSQVVMSGTGSVKNLEQPLGNCWKMGWTQQGLASFVSECYRSSINPVKSPVGWLTTMALPRAGAENPR